jgi:hypothetical protein
MAHAGRARSTAGNARLNDANSQPGRCTLAGTRGSYNACTENKNVVTIHSLFNRASELLLLLAGFGLTQSGFGISPAIVDHFEYKNEG